MDFLNRSAPRPAGGHNNGGSNGPLATPGARPNGTENSTGAKPPADTSKGAGFFSEPWWMRLAAMILLFSLTILGVFIVFLLYFGNPSEAKYIGRNKEQAVFLTNGQVYFGSIKSITSKYIDLRGIFYLNNQSQQNGTSTNNSTSNSFQLIKLGCELHGPYDEMLINRDQVTFWENLRSDGQVAKAIATWAQQNPNGQTCTQSTNSTQQSSGTSGSNSSSSSSNGSSSSGTSGNSSSQSPAATKP